MENGDFLHHNDGMHLAGGVLNDAVWKINFRRLAAQSASWYYTPPEEVERQFTAVLAAEWRGLLNWNWNSEINLVFANVVLTKTLDARKAREIWARIDRRLDLWEKKIYAGLVGYALTEGRAQEGRIKRHVEEEEDRLACSFHITVLWGKLRQAVCWATDIEGGGVSSPGRRLHEDQATGCGCPPGETR